MIGQLLRERREALGLSQTEVARRAGSSQRQVSRLENNQEAMPRRDTLERFGAVLGITLAEFYQAAGLVPQDIAEEQQRADDDEERIWRAIWSTKPLATQLRRAQRLESPEAFGHLLERSFLLTAKALEIDLDDLERGRDHPSAMSAASD